MPEQTPKQTNTEDSGDQYLQPARVCYELLPDTELDFAKEKSRIEAWRHSGECLPPTAIGTLTVPPDVITSLSRTVTNEYVILPGNACFSPDETIAAQAADGEQISPLEEEARTYLQEIYTQFQLLVHEDINRATLDEDTALEQTVQNTHIGLYENDDPPHCDDLEEFTIRYIVTLTGPATIFYSGHLPSHLFDNGGELASGVSIPASAQEIQPLAGQVVRFNSHDPHSSPNTDDPSEPVFRIVLDATFATTSTAT